MKKINVFFILAVFLLLSFPALGVTTQEAESCLTKIGITKGKTVYVRNYSYGNYEKLSRQTALVINSISINKAETEGRVEIHITAVLTNGEGLADGEPYTLFHGYSSDSEDIERSIKHNVWINHQEIAKEFGGGFRGIFWGADFSNVSNEMQYLRTDPSFGGVKEYSRKNDELRIGGAILQSIEYGFWQNKLTCVSVYCTGDVNFLNLKDAIFQKFGSGRQPNEYIEEYYWNIEPSQTTMILKYNTVTKVTMFYMSSQKFAKLQKQYDDENAKKGAATDF